MEYFSAGGFLVHRNHYGVKMNKNSGQSKAAADKLVKNIRCKTRQTYSAEEKIRIVLAGLRGEERFLRCAAVRVLQKAFITVGPENSLKPVNVVYPAIQRVRPHRQK